MKELEGFPGGSDGKESAYNTGDPGCLPKRMFTGYVLKKGAIVRHPIRIHWENGEVKRCLLTSVNNRGITVGLVGESERLEKPPLSLNQFMVRSAGHRGKMGLLWWFSLFIGQHDLLKYMDFPGGSAGKESACNAGDLGSIPGLGKSPGEGNSYPLQYSGLENSAGATFTWI